MQFKSRTRLRLCLFATAALLLVLPAAASADAEPAGAGCIGLDCGRVATPDYVPEAHGAVPAASGVDELRTRRESGFYTVPAPIYKGDVQPQAVVYFAAPGQLGQMPESVRKLRVVQDYVQAEGSKLDAVSLVVVDSGMLRVNHLEPVAASAKRPKARAALDPHGCLPRYFCLWWEVGFAGDSEDWYGPIFAGAGWYNLGTNMGASMVNYRDGDTLLADHGAGEGTRYCAQQQSEDSTFANNPIGNYNASSIALLGSTPDRC